MDSNKTTSVSKPSGGNPISAHSPQLQAVNEVVGSQTAPLSKGSHMGLRKTRKLYFNMLFIISILSISIFVVRCATKIGIRPLGPRMASLGPRSLAEKRSASLAKLINVCSTTLDLTDGTMKGAQLQREKSLTSTKTITTGSGKQGIYPKVAAQDLQDSSSLTSRSSGSSTSEGSSSSSEGNKEKKWLLGQWISKNKKRRFVQGEDDPPQLSVVEPRQAAASNTIWWLSNWVERHENGYRLLPQIRSAGGNSTNPEKPVSMEAH